MAVKQDLSKLSINQLSHITGKAYNTVKRSLMGLDAIDQDGRTLLYATPDALAKIYGAKTEPEKDRLDRLRADRIDFDLSIERKQTAPIKILRDVLADVASQACAVFDGLPKRIKNSLPALRAREMRILEKELNKARQALSEIQITFN